MAGIARLLHKRGSNGERVIGLDHLEHRVWVQYVLSADDYGVMRASASVLKADNRKLEQESSKRLEKAMAAVLASTLVQAFTHQGTVYWWQADWQDFQQIQYPKDTILPAPPVDALVLATPLTRDLFSVHELPSSERKEVLQALRKQRKKGHGIFLENSKTSSAYACARVRETQTQTQIQTQTDLSSEDPDGIPISTTPPAWRRRTAAAPGQRDLDYHRRNCPVDPAWAEAACNAGICIPKYLWPQWEHRKPVEELRAFVTAWATRVTGDRAEDFWPAAFESHFGTSAARAPQTREQRMTAAAAETLAAIARGDV
jgi:hypothetical protein